MTAVATLVTILLLTLAADSAQQPVRPAVAPADPFPLDEAAAGCDRYAAPDGADWRAGTRERPFRGVRRLVRSLRPGETGCLMPGRYRQLGEPTQLRRPRTRLVGIDGRARVDGAIWIAERARGAEIRGLDVTATDPVYFIPIKVQADRARIFANRIHGSRSTTCVLVGSTRRPHGVRIEQNWIHDCGRRGKLDHLIYVQYAVGTRIRHNALTGNRGGWGVHLFPDADRNVIEDNLIDGNLGGVIFGGEGSRTSDGNVVRANVITFSGPRWNLEGSWDDRFGADNVAYDNCLHSDGADAPSGIAPQYGFTATANAIGGSSPYTVRRRGERSFAAGSACGRLVSPLPQAFLVPTR